MKLLIVGGAGQVGKELASRAPAEWDVRAVDRQQLDITDSAAVERQVADFQPDVIINAAAYTAVDRAESEQALAYAINRDGPAALAAAAHHAGSALLHISTDYVFPGDKAGTYREDDQTGPTGVYGASKLAGEEAVAAACPRHIILRTAWVFGAYGNNFVKTMIRLARDRDQLSVVSDQLGSPTYAGDIAETLLAIARQVAGKADAPWGIYHYSGAPYTCWSDFAGALLDHAAEAGIIARKPRINPITTAEYPTPAQRPANSRLDCSKIGAAFGIAPSDWQAALRDITRYA